MVDNLQDTTPPTYEPPQPGAPKLKSTVKLPNQLTHAQQKWYSEHITNICKEPTVQRHIYAEAMLTKEFVRGNQWIYIDRWMNIKSIPVDSKFVEEHKRPRPRETVNLMYPIWRTYKSYLIQSRPRVVAVPESAEEIGDLISSRIATKIVEYLYEETIQRAISEEVFNTILYFGTVVLHPVYDKSTEKVRVHVIPPSDIFVYPRGATSMRDVKGICWRRSIDRSVAERLYGRKFSPDAHTEFTDASYAVMSGILENEDNVTLYDYWELPIGGSQGVWIQRVGDEIVASLAKFPYKNKGADGELQLPFVFIHESKDCGNFFGYSILWQIRDRQMSYNKAKSKLVQILNMTPKMLLDVNSRISSDWFYDDDVSLIEYNSRMDAHPPTYTGTPQISPSLVQNVNLMPQELEHVSGFHDITLRSEGAGYIQSGVGVKTLLERDEVRLVPALESLRQGYVQCFSQIYALVQQYYEDDQIRQILGERGEIDLLHFRELELKPMHFKIEETSFTPFSMAYRQQLMTQLLQYQVFDMSDEVVRANVYEYLDPNLALRFSDVSKESYLARSENARMLDGEAIQPNPDDVHPIHIREHNLIAKDPNFKDLSDGIKKLFLMHIEMHRVLIQEAQQRAMVQEQAAKAAVQGAQQQRGQAEPQEQPTE